jgi:ribonucleoside-diphosphate reductase alpha chain
LKKDIKLRDWLLKPLILRHALKGRPMSIKIDQPIVGWSVVTTENTPKPTEEKTTKPVEKEKLKKRPSVLQGETHKLTNHAKGYNLYVTVNYNEGKPFELFIDSSHTDSVEFIKGIARLCSAMLRTPHFDLEFVAKELMKIHSDQGYHAGGKNGFVPGIVAHIGKVLMSIHKQGIKSPTVDLEPSTVVEEVPTQGVETKACPECSGDMIRLDGCFTCRDCGWSKCQ